ncbi:DJ-1/PfpI family protein, variant 3 [Blastomyces gilchristii SLH14081]|uniref:DJ-1/PfpI family protein n=1 Tax=Blastomyces gilchristii (strain SLH14081) TaxID=559298 RepID=A0A179UP05_BLAGS|nr:DJ-1/PfpI family protein [Blastomyces gilchristii SLH14081]XP_031579022.1 DJ-1/PfpI family protein, variant 1 [Blastomyces gilchristii SLH14081]XP_031579023.1 DJ-1/PfpI family protein, variant 2 [Blastomyces gilchristii SLH14081]XP_031579024.1 DJ-1/PfpI family protein, variant 3 [Blastomyces gilchristii SLH14081]OAT09814.1 DJ-1/PfpI family protein [Blastomyces gilchristii SLH14081]OAT09815.1 DJ-1/PfpI family protein, variant 1 [Blastomyces gilchristii SLH14081]OAT09816.1 DJ-1/PfpI family p
MAANASAPVHYAVLLFPGFQALDAFGPLDILNIVALEQEIQLSIIGPTMDPVSTKSPIPNFYTTTSTSHQSVVPTHTYDAPPENIDVMIVPGGFGTRHETIKPTVQFLIERYPRIRYLLTVCTGSYVAAQAGILDGKKATTNKIRFDLVAAKAPQVNWVRQARWVVDGNIWTSSGVSAGMDEMLAFVQEVYGRKLAVKVATILEYNWHEDSTTDPFANSPLVEMYGAGAADWYDFRAATAIGKDRASSQ